MTLSARFADLAERGEKALVLFVTAGDPTLEDLPALLDCLQGAGADVIEIGMPFSDPIADGPTIQASNQRALDQDVSASQVLATMGRCDLRVPVVLMGYYNPVLRTGLEAFAKSARDAGASGTILSDLTPEEAGPWVTASRAAVLDTVFLVAPTSTDERIAMACRHATGFVYAVSRTGVTGAASTASADVGDLVSRVKACTDLPVCVGFGISKPEHVRAVSKVADGVVVGSWLVDLVQREWRGGNGAATIAAQVMELKAATREASA